MFFLCFSLIYEQNGAVHIHQSGSSGTFISCSWNGNTAPAGYQEKQTAAFAIIYQYNVPKIVSNSVCAAACSGQASCKGFENHAEGCALVTSYGTGNFFRENKNGQYDAYYSGLKSNNVRNIYIRKFHISNRYSKNIRQIFASSSFKHFHCAHHSKI